MQIRTTKKAIFPLIDFSLPREVEGTVSIYADTEIYITISSLDFTFRTQIEGEILSKGEALFKLSNLRKSISRTKAKYPLVLSDTGWEQAEEEKNEELEPAEAQITPLEANSLFYAELPEALSVSLGVLPLFAKKDALHTWRDQIFFSVNDKGISFKQSNGIHLATVSLDIPITGLEPFTGFIPAYLMNIFSFYFSKMKGVRMVEGEKCFGCITETDQFILRYEAAPLLHIDVPEYASYAAFHLNPIRKKAYEKALLEKVRKYRDDHLLEYPDINLTFQVERNPEGNDFLVTAFLSHEKENLTEVLTTTSPFYSGTLPDIALPAYDFIKAMGAMQRIDSLHITDRGVRLSFVDLYIPLFEDQQGYMIESNIFLHGRRKKHLHK